MKPATVKDVAKLIELKIDHLSEDEAFHIELIHKTSFSGDIVERCDRLKRILAQKAILEALRDELRDGFTLE